MAIENPFIRDRYWAIVLKLGKSGVQALPVRKQSLHSACHKPWSRPRLKLVARHWLTVVAVVCTFNAFVAQTHAENIAQPPSRHALVLGNNAYAFGSLANAHHDAELMAKTLVKLGFEVENANNLSRADLFTTVRRFGDNLPAGAIALVYYAGHGMQLQGSNYLIPVDMQPTGEQSAALKAFPLQTLMERLSHAPSAVNIVILDACRNNPFRPASSRFRDLSKMGLAKIATPKGTVIAYSTAPGQYAADGVGSSNSLYTQILSEELLRPGQTIEAVLKNVADSVRKKTLDDQQPWYETSLVDSLYFIPTSDVTMLTQAPTKNTKQQSVATRSVQMQTPDWYLSLHGEEWAELEYQIAQRAAHLTKDDVPLLSYRANNGNVIAMTTLALAYQDGFREGRLDNGDYITMTTLAPTYQNSFQQGRAANGSVARDGASNKKSLSWLLKAAKAGFPIAQRGLGEMYLLGTGTDFDRDLGLHWLEQAAQSDYPLARLDLAQRQYDSNPTAETSQKLWVTIQDQAKAMQDHRMELMRQLTSTPH